MKPQAQISEHKHLLQGFFYFTKKITTTLSTEQAVQYNMTSIRVQKVFYAQ